jgi:hypothetical protein
MVVRVELDRAQELAPRQLALERGSSSITLRSLEADSS